MNAAMIVFDCHFRQSNHNAHSLARESRDRLDNASCWLTENNCLWSIRMNERHCSLTSPPGIALPGFYDDVFVAARNETDETVEAVLCGQ
jgi:hypothetical protein